MIIIAMGANLPGAHGGPQETLKAAMQKMEASGIKILKTSRTWLTAPVPVSDQPWYHNAVLSVKTKLGAHELLAELHEIEAFFGRERRNRNASRVLDLDLISYKDFVVNDCKNVIIPHPRMHERAFVLLPLQEVEPMWVHPASGRSVGELIGALPSGQEAIPIEETSGSEEHGRGYGVR